MTAFRAGVLLLTCYVSLDQPLPSVALIYSSPKWDMYSLKDSEVLVSKLSEVVAYETPWAELKPLAEVGGRQGSGTEARLGKMVHSRLPGERRPLS